MFVSGVKAVEPDTVLDRRRRCRERLCVIRRLPKRGQYEAILFSDNPFPGVGGEIAIGASTGNDVKGLVPFLSWVDKIPVHSVAERSPAL